MINWRCWFRHAWKTRQHFFRSSDGHDVDVVIAWKQCKRCARSKLVHILV